VSDIREIASFEEITYSNMIIVEALVDQLSKKGLIERGQLTERIKELGAQTRIGPAAVPVERVTVARSDLISSNHVVLELLLDLLLDKGFLMPDDVSELKTRLLERINTLRRTQ
jgi:hypothetical protein